MDIKELRQKSAEELGRLTEELRSQIRDLRFKAHLRSLRQVRTLRQAKKDFARVLMVLASMK